MGYGGLVSEIKIYLFSQLTHGSHKIYYQSQSSLNAPKYVACIFYMYLKYVCVYDNIKALNWSKQNIKNKKKYLNNKIIYLYNYILYLNKNGNVYMYIFL